MRDRHAGQGGGAHRNAHIKMPTKKKTRRSGSSRYDFAVACFGNVELLRFFGRSSSGVGSRSGSGVGGRSHRVGSRSGSSGSGVGRSSGSVASGSGGVAGSGGGVGSGVASSGSGVGGGIGGFGSGFGGGVSSGFFGLVASRQSEDASGEEDVKLRIHAFLQRSCLKEHKGSGNASARGSPANTPA